MRPLVLAAPNGFGFIEARSPRPYLASDEISGILLLDGLSACPGSFSIALEWMSAMDPARNPVQQGPNPEEANSMRREFWHAILVLLAVRPVSGVRGSEGWSTFPQRVHALED